MSGLEPFLLAGAASAGTATAAGTGFSIFSALSTGLSLASAAGSLFSGIQGKQSASMQSKMEAQALEMSAREDMLAAKEEGIRGKQEANDIMDSLLQTVSSQRLSYQAAGVDANFGTPASVNENARRIAELQLGVTRDDAQIRAIARRRQAYARTIEAGNVRTMGRVTGNSKLTSGVFEAGTGIAKLIQRRGERG